VLILKEVKVVCFDTLLQVLILNNIEERSGSGARRDDRATRVKANDNAETRLPDGQAQRARRPRRGTPTRVFCAKSSDLLDYKGFAVFGMAKESATVSSERTYGAENGRGVELTWESLPSRQLLCQDIL
jgi:hypothetical protein